MKCPRPLRILQVVGSLDRAWGGLSLYVAELASQLAARDHQVQVLCQPGALKDPWSTSGVEVIQSKSSSKDWLPALESADVIHVHGLWLPHYHRVLSIARRLGKPYLLSVHGMLEPGALCFSKWKKRLALMLYQRRDLQVAPVLHATAERELNTLRKFSLSQPVAILPPGVRMPATRQTLPKAVTDRRALFLGRIHPVKGILPLIEAWATVRPKNWRLDIAGPDEAGYLIEVQRAIRGHKLEREVVYLGAVFGDAKERLLCEASLLIAPSLTENFGIAIVEALAHGLPVITTTGTPWQILQREGCGWWVPAKINSLALALREATTLTPEGLDQMGLRGRRVAETEFDWPQIARRMEEVYSCLINGGALPACVHLI